MNDKFNEIDFRGIDLNVLLIFMALMRERSVTKAAARMYLGPPAVSMALRRLRELFGDELLVRAGRKMEPTERALTLYPQIEAALTQLHSALLRPEAIEPAHLVRTFRFAAPDDLELALVPLLLERVREEAPNVRLVIRPSDFRHALTDLDNSECDLALTAMPDRLDSWHRHKVLHQETFLCVYDQKQLQCRGKLSLKRYLSTPHLLLSPLGHLHSALDDQLKKDDLQRDVLMAIAHFPLMPFLLRKTPSLANMPALAARMYAREFDLEISPLPIPSLKFDLALLWHLRNDGDLALRWFAGLVESIVHQLRASSR